ncbi:MAG TPA: nucleotidyltransferase domain-containing protein [Gammaproteobacteria bacterium]|jgi:predicted nucleotidyltransferase|nr:nucleotidyltransferase domain-containing protein [Gammaproteobacteria bacterium]
MSDDSSNVLLERLAQVLEARVPDLIAVYRFGSFGTAAMRADSDIDLGLLAERPLDPVHLFDVAGELATLAGRDVDLVDLITCSTVMRAQVIATGERLLCRDAFRCESFADTAFSRYAHLNEARRGILADIQARGTVHGG